MRGLLQMSPINKSLKEIQKERINSFEKMYEATFKEKITLNDKVENEKNSFSLNFYGVKSNWL